MGEPIPGGGKGEEVCVGGGGAPGRLTTRLQSVSEGKSVLRQVVNAEFVASWSDVTARDAEGEG